MIFELSYLFNSNQPNVVISCSFASFFMKTSLVASSIAGLLTLSAGLVVNAGSASAASLTKIIGFEASSGSINCGGVYLCSAPPDTMGAVGLNQYLETTNGSQAVYSKSGTLLQRYTLSDFWNKAGLTGGSDGDQRVLFDFYTQRWIVTGFSQSDTSGYLNIAVSDTANALGTWKGTTFQAFNLGTNPNPDYPTLGIDDKAVYIGTNNFNNSGFQGSSLFVIPKSDLFGGSPTAANRSTFYNKTNPTTLQAPVNWQGNAANSTPILGNDYTSISLDLVKANISNLLAVSFSSPTRVGLPAYTFAGAARQPNGSRVIDTIDDRISANTYLVNGRLYGVHTVKIGSDYAKLQWFVVNANTGALIDSGLIGQDGYDYYEGSIAVNGSGRAVLSYNRSGTPAANGNISIFAQAFLIAPGGGMIADGMPLLLKSSPIANYCSSRCVAPVGRWGDYAAITLDPVDTDSFWVIGEYATGADQFTGWNTYVSQLKFNATVPAPAPLLGMPVLFGWSLRMRQRLRRARPGSFSSGY